MAPVFLPELMEQERTITELLAEKDRWQRENEEQNRSIDRYVTLVAELEDEGRIQRERLSEVIASMRTVHAREQGLEDQLVAVQTELEWMIRDTTTGHPTTQPSQRTTMMMGAIDPEDARGEVPRLQEDL